MSEDESGAAPTAADLRMRMLERELERLGRDRAARERAEQEHTRFVDSFLNQHLSAQELEMIRRIVLQAVKDGKLEAMIYTFPCKLCTDGGRAINNGEPDWPNTLQGKARELYEGYEAKGRPAGYRLKAMVVSFPDGLPGDVGLYLSWAPPAA